MSGSSGCLRSLGDNCRLIRFTLICLDSSGYKSCNGRFNSMVVVPERTLRDAPLTNPSDPCNSFSTLPILHRALGWDGSCMRTSPKLILATVSLAPFLPLEWTSRSPARYSVFHLLQKFPKTVFRLHHASC